MCSVTRQSHDGNWIGLLFGPIDRSDGVRLAILYQSYDSGFALAENSVGVGVPKQIIRVVLTLNIKKCVQV